MDGIQSKRAHVNERVKQVTAALTFHDIPAVLVQRVVDSIEYYASQHYGTQDREIMEVFPERYLELCCVLLFQLLSCVHLVHNNGCLASGYGQILLLLYWVKCTRPSEFS